MSENDIRIIRIATVTVTVAIYLQSVKGDTLGSGIFINIFLLSKFS